MCEETRSTSFPIHLWKAEGEKTDQVRGATYLARGPWAKATSGVGIYGQARRTCSSES